MMNITTVGVDLAKEVITICTMDTHGHVLKTRDLRASEFSAWLVTKAITDQSGKSSKKDKSGSVSRNDAARLAYSRKAELTEDDISRLVNGINVKNEFWELEPSTHCYLHTPSVHQADDSGVTKTIRIKSI